MSNPSPTLTISIPAYNDGETIEAVVKEAIDAAQHVTDRFEILVINDGSRDDTADRVKQLQQSIPNVRYHEHPVNLGFGPTIREAYTLPQTEWVYFIPGDNQCPAEEVISLFRAANDADFILGYRVTRNDTWQRRIVSRFYNMMISIVAFRRIHDTNAAGLLRRASLDASRLHSQTAFIHAEILLEVLRQGGRVVEVPASHRPREHGTPSGNKWRVILGTFKELWLYAVDRRLGIPTWRNR